MAFRDKLTKGQFVVTTEIGPPKGVDTAPLLEGAEHIKPFVDAMNVTDLQSSMMRLGSMAVCRLLSDIGVEPILQMTCRDRNRLALQSDILSAYVLGIKNVLALTGDHPILGDHPDAKPVYDLDAVTLLDAISKLNGGRDLAGKELKGKPDMYCGAAVNHGMDPIGPEMLKMEKKIRAGAKFFQTQAVFDMGIYETFYKDAAGFGVPIIAGIVILKSGAMARYMNKNVPGVYVPEDIIHEMENASNKEEKAVEIASRIIRRLKGVSGGIHIMPIGWDRLVLPILEASGLKKG